jgi:hypothetical protein
MAGLILRDAKDAWSGVLSAVVILVHVVYLVRFFCAKTIHAAPTLVPVLLIARAARICAMRPCCIRAPNRPQLAH